MVFVPVLEDLLVGPEKNSVAQLCDMPDIGKLAQLLRDEFFK